MASVNPFVELFSYFFAAVVKAVDPRGLKSVVLTNPEIRLPNLALTQAFEQRLGFNEF